MEKLKDLMKDAALLGFDDDNNKHESIEVLAASIADVRSFGHPARSLVNVELVTRRMGRVRFVLVAAVRQVAKAHQVHEHG